MSKTAALQLQLGDHAIAAWWEGQHYAASAAAGRPAVSPVYDVTVSPREPLQAALDLCRVGGNVLLLPGAYEGGVVLSKEVHLYGRGEATLRGAAGEGPVITSTAPAATLDGLIVRLGPHAEGEEGHYGILITAGSLLVRHCDVSSRSRSNICVRGASANPTILGCKVHGSKKSGIVFEEGSQGRVEGCDVVGNDIFGLGIDSSGPVIVANKIHRNKSRGVSIVGISERSAKLEENRIFENGGSGVAILGGADPSLVANDIHSSKKTGIFVSGGKGRLERKCLWGNGQGGIWVQGRGDPTLIASTFRNHAGVDGFGVYVHGTAFGKVVWGDGNCFSGNEAGDLLCEEEESAPAGGQPAQAPPAAALPATPADVKLLRELECVVCKDVMLRPSSVCPEGHASACMPCYKQLKACPVCRGKLLSPPCRLRLLEGLAQDTGLLVPCPHAADGCPLNALRYADAGAHANTCDWRKVARVNLRMYLSPSLPDLLTCLWRIVPLAAFSGQQARWM